MSIIAVLAVITGWKTNAGDQPIGTTRTSADIIQPTSLPCGCSAQARGMAFHVLIIGGRQRVEYARLRAALDRLLARRLPDVAILTAGGPGVPALAACYARERGLPLTAVPLDYTNHRADAAQWRDARLVEMADAAVLVGDATEVRELLDRAPGKGIRLVALWCEPQREEPNEPAAEPVQKPVFPNLPD